MLKLGYPDFRVVKKSKISITNKQVQDKIGNIEFYSYTISLFKLIPLIKSDLNRKVSYCVKLSRCKFQSLYINNHENLPHNPTAFCM